MRIAFYAPLKPPSHPVPSGDRRMARLLMAALDRAGHDVELASRLRTFDPVGDPKRQLEIAEICRNQVPRLLRRFQNRPAKEQPAAWITYHVYYKAPDWFGPRIADALSIPYVVIEASHAGKRANGPWSLGHDAAAAAIRRADALLLPNAADAECLLPLLADPGRLVTMPPFLDLEPYQNAAIDRIRHRKALARTHDLDPYQIWLLAVGMMRPGDKHESYRTLANALRRISHLPWHLIVVGDGPERASVEAMLGSIGPARVSFTGALSEARLAGYYAACDLFVWPAIREAYGMAMLEAQASGLPVVAGNEGGVAGIVDAGTTGLLTPPGDDDAFARALSGLMAHAERRETMRQAALAKTGEKHGLSRAARLLDRVLTKLSAPA
jgi:glycosyltransferase involved in cell wall biosynthesis